MELLCGVGSDGKITACKTLSHSETPSVGARTAEEPFRSQFVGKDKNLEGVAAISNATISSQAYISAIRDAFAALDLVKEGA